MQLPAEHIAKRFLFIWFCSIRIASAIQWHALLNGKMADKSSAAAANPSQDIELSFSERRREAAADSPAAAPAGEVPRPFVRLKARFYSHAESGSAPALLEKDREGAEPEISEFGNDSEPSWHGQLQPVSPAKSPTPVAPGRSTFWTRPDDPTAAKHQQGIFWQQMHRGPGESPSVQQETQASLQNEIAAHADKKPLASTPPGEP